MNKCFFLCFLSILFVGTPLSLAATCNGIDLYVGMTGSDTNLGSLAAPLATITRADQIIEARGVDAGGSVIYLLPGAYTETRAPFTSIQLRADGYLGCPVTLRSYDPDTLSVLHGEGTHAILGLDAVNYYNVRYIIIENGTSGITGYYRNTIIENSSIRNIRNSGDNNPAAIRTLTNYENDDNTIRYNHIYNVTTDGTGASMNAAGIVFFQGNRNVINNNLIHNVNVGIRQKHHQQPPSPFSLQVHHNLIYNVEDAGISLGSSGAQVTRNVIVNSSGDGIRVGYGDSASFNNGFRNNTISHNTIFNVSTGISFQWGSSDQQTFDAVVRDNAIHARSRIYYVQDWQNILDSDTNCYSQNSFRVTTQNPTTISTLQAQGHDSASIISDTISSAAYRLITGSPCKNAASDNTDIGAYESESDSRMIGFQLYNSEPPSTGICEATGSGACYYVADTGNDELTAASDCMGLQSILPTVPVDGTFSSPWKSLQKAAYYARPGDYIYIRGGNYDTSCRTYPNNAQYAYFSLQDGTASQPITLKAYPSETAIVSRRVQLNAPYANGARGNYHVIDGLTIAHVNQGTGIDVWSEGNYIKNNHIYNITDSVNGCGENPGTIRFSAMGGGTIYQAARNAIVENNTLHDVYDPVYGDYLGTKNAPIFAENCAGIKFLANVGNITIRNNTIYNTPAGIHLKYNGHGYNNLIANNTIYNTKTGVYGSNANWAFKQNIVFNSSVGVRAGNMGPGGVSPAGAGFNVTIQQNTFVNNDFSVSIVNGSTNVSNNIFYQPTSTCSGNPTGTNGQTSCQLYIYNGYYGDGFPNADFNQLTINNNCYFANSNQKMWRYGMDGSFNTYHNLTDVQSRYDREQGSVVADPQFVNAAAGNFRLQQGSPCSAMGVDGDPEVVTPSIEASPVFFDDFDTGAKTAAQNGYGWGSTTAVDVSIDRPYSGSHSLRFRFGPDAETASDDAWSEQRFILGEYLPEAWFEYMLYIPPNFYHRRMVNDTFNNKFFLIWRDVYAGTYGDWLGGYEYERSAAIDGDSTLRSYGRSPAGGLNNIQGAQVDNTKPLISDNGPIVRGSWNRVQLHFKTATGPDTYDGVMELWVNEKLKFQKTDGRFWYPMNLNDGSPNPLYTDATCTLRNGYILGWANSGFTEQTNLYVDDFTIYKQDPGWNRETTDTVVQNRMVNTTPSAMTHTNFMRLGPGTQRKIVACTSLEHASAAFTNVNYNGAPMMLLRDNRAGTAHLACYGYDVPDALPNNTYPLTYTTSSSVTTTLVAWQLRNTRLGLPESLSSTTELANQGGNLSITLANVTRNSWVLSAVTDAGTSVSYSVEQPFVAAGGSTLASHNTRYADDMREASGATTVKWIPTITTGNRVAIALSVANRYETLFQPGPPRVGDLNGDGVVNVSDVILIITNFKRRMNYDTGADINGDGTVNIYDMVLLGRNWG